MMFFVVEKDNRFQMDKMVCIGIINFGLFTF